MFLLMAALLDVLLLGCTMGCPDLDIAFPFSRPYLARSPSGVRPHCGNEPVMIQPSDPGPLLRGLHADFWARWNVPQAQLLKALVYDPIMEGRLVKEQQRTPAPPAAQQPQPRRAVVQAAAVLVTFAFSGAEHVLFYW